MKVSSLIKMINGYFIGDFNPSLVKTSDFEVAVKEFKSGDTEKAHYHKIVTEFTIIISGRVKMHNREFEENDIIQTEPMEITSFEAITDAKLLVVKIPSIPNDKYEV